MNVALLVFVLAFGWALATGDFSILNLALGAAVAAVALFLIRGQVTRPRSLTRLRRMLSLGGLPSRLSMNLTCVSIALWMSVWTQP